MSAPTVREKILCAAAGLPGTFTRAQLAVAAWRLFPETFSLRGVEERLPDSNAVYAKLSGIDGLTARGWLEPTDVESVYAVTRQGLAHAVGLGVEGAEERLRALPVRPALLRVPARPRKAKKPPQGREGGAHLVRPVVKVVPPPAPPVLSPLEAETVRLLARTPAVALHARGGAVLSATVAHGFWRVGGGMEATGALLARAGVEGATVAGGGLPPDPVTVASLAMLHRLLVSRFGGTP